MDFLQLFCHECHEIDTAATAAEIMPEFVGCEMEECAQCMAVACIDIKDYINTDEILEPFIYKCPKSHDSLVYLSCGCDACMVPYDIAKIELPVRQCPYKK